ncbi:MAG: hypothetical protein RL682_1357, partial [Pseudomonadota bacterium]
RVLGRQMFEHGDQNRVFEHVGVVAGVEGVAVREHAPMLTGGPAPKKAAGRPEASLSA